MFTEVKTVITSRIEIGDGGFEGVEHSVSIEAGEFGASVGTRALLVVVEGGLKSALLAVKRQAGNTELDEWDEDGDDE